MSDGNKQPPQDTLRKLLDELIESATSGGAKEVSEARAAVMDDLVVHQYFASFSVRNEKRQALGHTVFKCSDPIDAETFGEFIEAVAAEEGCHPNDLVIINLTKLK